LSRARRIASESSACTHPCISNWRSTACRRT
jgi:hypothetical protein